MIKVVIIDDKRIIESIYENPDDDIRVAWAQEGPESRGYAVFRSCGELLYIVDKDNIFELLVRSALNHLDLTGVETAYTSNEAMFAGLYLLGFKKNGERLEVNIKEFFKPCGGCK
ncbi:MAG: hypothetical protein ACI4SS_05100 [Clostridia bacterium]